MAQTEDPDFVQVRIRVRKSLHAQIEKAAEGRGTSMNSEIADRLERSFQMDRIIGGPIIEDRPVLAIAKMVASVMHDAGRHAAFSATMSAERTANWYDHPYAYEQAVAGANRVLAAFRPAGNPDAPKLLDGLGTDLSAALSHLGEGFAMTLISNIAGEKRSAGEPSREALLRDELGPLVNRIKDDSGVHIHRPRSKKNKAAQ